MLWLKSADNCFVSNSFEVNQCWVSACIFEHVFYSLIQNEMKMDIMFGLWKDKRQGNMQNSNNQKWLSLVFI